MSSVTANGVSLCYAESGAGPAAAYIHVIGVASYARRLVAPTLVLRGSNDRKLAAALGEEMARTIAGAHRHVMQGESHSLVIRSGAARQVVMAFQDEQEAKHV